MIAIEDVTLRIGGRLLLASVTLDVNAGDFLAVVGPNGVGKTTLLRAVAGMHALYGGRIVVGDIPIARLAPAQRARRLALVAADELLLDALHVRDVVAIARFPYHRWWEWRERPSDDDAVTRALQQVGLESFGQRLFGTLSSGERQRVWIAMGLAQETPVLLLDEPTSHLDVRVAHEILALLAELAEAGKTIVCVLHDLNDAAGYANHIALLGEGRLLADGTPDRVLGEEGLLEAAYGIAMERVRLQDGRLRVFARGHRGGVAR
jgi:ABC-type cobalamin/Fe3+-siderophores transport system ATPase subunit